MALRISEVIHVRQAKRPIAGYYLQSTRGQTILSKSPEADSDMSIEKINLRKLLQLFFAEERQQRSLLLTDIRSEAAKASGFRSSGAISMGRFGRMLKTTLQDDQTYGRKWVTEFCQTRRELGSIHF